MHKTKVFGSLFAMVALMFGIPYVKPTHTAPQSPYAVAQISHQDRAHAGRRDPVAAPPVVQPPRVKAKSKKKAKRPPAQRTTTVAQQRPAAPATPATLAPVATTTAYDSAFCRNARWQSSMLTDEVRRSMRDNATAAQKKRYAPCFR